MSTGQELPTRSQGLRLRTPLGLGRLDRADKALPAPRLRDAVDRVFLKRSCSPLGLTP